MGIEAATLGKVALGAQAIGGVAASVGAYNKAKAERTAYEMQAQVAENNKQFALWQAEDALVRGEKATVASQLRTRQLKGKQIASMAGRGIDLGEGSALNILTDTDLMGEIDANTVKDNAAKEAYGHRTSAANFGANADLLRFRASNTSPSGAAFGTLLTSAGSVASSWYMMDSKGTFDKPGKKSSPSINWNIG
jgi:hypothetical protein